MENPSSSSEGDSDSETEQSDSENSDLYDDLESSSSQELPKNLSTYTDVDDSDIFLELGMSTNDDDHMSEGKSSLSAAENSKADTESVNDDMKNEIGENDCEEKCTVPETKDDERQYLRICTQKKTDAVAGKINGSKQSNKECKGHMNLQESDKIKDFENMVAATVVTSEQVESGKIANPRPICNAPERLNFLTSANKDVQFILSCLLRKKGLSLENSSEENMNAYIPKLDKDLTLYESCPSESDIEKLRISPRSSEYVSESRMLRDERSTLNFSWAKETVADTTDVVRDNNRVLSQSTSEGEEAMGLTGDQRKCALDFFTSELREGHESASIKSTKRVRRKSGHKRKTDSQMDLFEDFLFNKGAGELAQEAAKLKLENENLQKQLAESQNRCTGLESDNEKLLSNISALWKTAMSQLRKKCSELALLKREKDAIIFRRAMRQVSKDDLDLIISRITAYNKDEFSTFMKSLQEEEEDEKKKCACSKVAPASLEKQSLTQRIKLSIRGTRVQSSSDTEAQTLKIMLGKQGERVTFIAEEVRKNKFKSTKIKDHKNSKNHNLFEISDTLSCGQSSQGYFQKNINNNNTDNEKCDAQNVEKSGRKSVFSRLGIRKPFVSPERFSVCNVKDVLKEKQNRESDRPHEAEGTHLHKSNELPSRNNKHTPIYYNDPKENTDDTLKEKRMCDDGNVIDPKYYNDPKENTDETLKEKKMYDDENVIEKDSRGGNLQSITSVTQADHIRNSEDVGCGTSQKDSTNGAKLLRPESPELHAEQYEIKERSKIGRIAQMNNFDTYVQEDEMLTKTLYGQRMKAKQKSWRGSQRRPSLQPAMSCSLHSLSVNSVSNSDCYNSSQPQDFGETDSSKKKVDEKSRVTRGSIKRVAKKANESEINDLSFNNFNNSGQLVNTEGEVNGNLRTNVLPSSQKVVEENDFAKKSHMKNVTQDGSNCNDQKDVFETNNFSVCDCTENFVPSLHAEKKEGHRKELLQDNSRLEHPVYHGEENVQDGRTGAKKNGKMHLETNSCIKYSFVREEMTSKRVREKSIEVHKENSKQIRMKEVNDTFCSSSDKSLLEDLKEQDKDSSNSKRNSEESNAEKKIGTPKMEGTNKIAKEKEKDKTSESKQTAEMSSMKKYCMTSNEIDKHESGTEGTILDAILSRHSDRKSNTEKSSSKISDVEILIEAGRDETSYKDYRRLRSLKTVLGCNRILDVDDKINHQLKKKEEIEDSNLLKAKDESATNIKNKELKSKKKKVKSKKSEVEDRKSDEGEGRNKWSEKGKVRGIKCKQGDISKEEGRKGDRSEKDDLKPEQKGIQYLKSKEKDISDPKFEEEENENLKSKEETGSDMISNEGEIIVKSKDEERKDKSKKRKRSSVKPEHDKIRITRSKKDKQCAKLGATEKNDMNPKFDNKKVDFSKDVKAKQNEKKVQEPNKEEEKDGKSEQLELKLNSLQTNKDEILEVQGLLPLTQKNGKGKSQVKLKDVNKKDRDGKSKEDKRGKLQFKTKEKDRKSEDERQWENTSFSLDEEMHGRDGEAGKDGDEGLMQNDTVYSEDCSAQDTRLNVCSSDNLSKKGSKNRSVEGERKEEILASHGEEIKPRDYEVGSDGESDVIDIFVTEYDIDVENSSNENESEVYKNQRYQGNRIYEIFGNSNADREEERKVECSHEMEEHDSETDDCNKSQRSDCQVFKIQEEQDFNNTNLQNHSNNIQGKEKNHETNGDNIYSHFNEKLIKHIEDAKKVNKTTEIEGNHEMNHHDQGENKNSAQNRKYTEESIFPEEEELLYDEGTDESDENESSQDDNESDAEPVNRTIRTSSPEDGITKLDAFHTGKTHDHETDMELKKDDLINQKVNLEKIRDSQAGEGKCKSIHDRLWNKKTVENDGKRIHSQVKAFANNETKNDYNDKTLQSKHKSPSLGNEENLDDEGTTNNNKWPSSKSKSSSKSRSPNKECMSENLGGRIRKLPKNIESRLHQSEASQSPLMERENRLQVKKGVLQEPLHKREDSSVRTRIPREQRKTTERPEESPIMMQSQRPERNLSPKCQISISPKRVLETRAQTKEKEKQTEITVKRKQNGSSRNKDEITTTKRRELEDRVDLQSKKRRVSVKSRLSRPKGYDEENHYAEARRYPSSPPEGRRRSSRLRNLFGEGRHIDDSFSELPERGISSRDRRNSVISNSEVSKQHDVKGRMGTKCTVKNTSANNVRVDSKLLQSVLGKSPSKYSLEEDEKEEGELDEDDEDKVQISETNKLIMGNAKNHTLINKNESKHHQNADKANCHSKSKWMYNSLKENKKNQECLSDLKHHQHVILEKKLQSATSEVASKHKKDSAITEQGMASGINLAHVLNEEPDIFSGNVESRMKVLPDSSEVMRDDQKHRRKSRAPGNLMEDATFYPSDLFQVVPIKAGSDRMNISSVTGPSSVSDDTIEMIVKRNNEMFGLDSRNSSDDSEMSLLQFIANASGNSGNGENERRKKTPVTQQSAVRKVNENILIPKDSIAREMCNKDNFEMSIKTGIYEVIQKTCVDNTIRLKESIPSKPENSSAPLSYRASTTLDVRELDNTSAKAEKNHSNNSSSTSDLNSIWSVAYDNQNRLEVSGDEEVELDRSCSKSSSSLHSYCGARIEKRLIPNYGKEMHYSHDIENYNKDGIETRDHIMNSNNKGIDTENEMKIDKYHSGGRNEYAGGTQSISEMLQPERYTESCVAPEAHNDGASSSSGDSDSDSDCECSKCASSSSSCSSSCCNSSSSGSDTDEENDVTDPAQGTNLLLETLQEQYVVDTQTPLTLLEECHEPGSRSPSLFNDISPTKAFSDSSDKVSQTPKTPKDSPKALHKLRKTPHKTCKTPCKKTPHKTPCKKSPHKTPCNKSPHKTPCKNTPHKIVFRNNRKISHKSPNLYSTETNTILSQKAVLNIASGDSGDLSLSSVAQDKTLKEEENINIANIKNTETAQEHKSLACANVNKEIKASSSTESRFLKDLNGNKNESIDTDGMNLCNETNGSIDTDGMNSRNKTNEVIDTEGMNSFNKTNEAPYTPASTHSSPTSVTVFLRGRRRRRASNFGQSSTSKVNLSCVNVNNVISVVHSKNADLEPMCTEKNPKNITSRSPKKSSPNVSQASFVTPVKEKQAHTPKRQLSPMSYVSEKENAVGKKIRLLSPEMFGKVSNRGLFPNVGSEISIDEDVRKPVDHSCASGSTLTSDQPSTRNSLFVPVRIRQAKRQLNLGFANPSTQNVFVTSDLSKNSKSSPQKNGSSAT